MDVAIIGAGPSGTTAALLLARAGHAVTLIDRDPGPVDGVVWERNGIMQWHLPHTFRAPGRNVLLQRVPELHDALVAAGGELHAPPGAPDFMANMHLRRRLLDEVMWRFADAEPRITRVHGHADEVLLDGARVTGLRVDGAIRTTDLVIDATGRAGRFAAELRPAFAGGDCGFAYAARHYALHDDADPGPLNGGPGFVAEHHGFLNLVFVQDARTFSILIVRDSHDEELAAMREEAVFDAFLAQLPTASAWVDRDRSQPIDRVRSGAGLANRYRRQATDVVGLLTIGDAACTTNPVAARGMSLGMLAAAAVADIVEQHPAAAWAAEMDQWSEANLRPWFEDHLIVDQVTHDRWAGKPIDPDGPISWNVIAAAAAEKPHLMATLGPFLGMALMPGALEPLRAEVRDLVRAGWQPPAPAGPTRDQLVAGLIGSKSAPKG